MVQAAVLVIHLLILFPMELQVVLVILQTIGFQMDLEDVNVMEQITSL